jgi:hypothetical protein
MNLILVKRERMRRRVGGGAVYPGQRGQTEEEGTARARRGVCPSGAPGTGLRALKDRGSGQT